MSALPVKRAWYQLQFGRHSDIANTAFCRSAIAKPTNKNSSTFRSPGSFAARGVTSNPFDCHLATR